MAFVKKGVKFTMKTSSEFLASALSSCACAENHHKTVKRTPRMHFPYVKLVLNCGIP